MAGEGSEDIIRTLMEALHGMDWEELDRVLSAVAAAGDGGDGPDEDTRHTLKQWYEVLHASLGAEPVIADLGADVEHLADSWLSYGSQPDLAPGLARLLRERAQSAGALGGPPSDETSLLPHLLDDQPPPERSRAVGEK